jgi:flagellar basal body-associated protein FliL
MNMNETETVIQEKSRSTRWIHIMGIVLLTMLVTVGLTYWILSTYIFAKEFKIVALDTGEEQVLDEKLRVLGIDPKVTAKPATDEFNEQGNLKPMRYSEKDAKHEVSFSQRELNALLANNTDLAKKVAIELSDDLVSARMLMPMDPDFPLLGGKTLRASAGVEMAYHGGKPIVVLKGVSIWGVPIPNAWLGNLKNIDLVGHYGTDQGFWKSFAAGVEDIRVEEGVLKIKLKE